MISAFDASTSGLNNENFNRIVFLLFFFSFVGPSFLSFEDHEFFQFVDTPQSLDYNITKDIDMVRQHERVCSWYFEFTALNDHLVYIRLIMTGHFYCI